MPITTGNTILASDFITESERNGTPSNDSGRVPQLEGDGKLDSFFTRDGNDLTYGETLNGATLPVPVYQDTSNGKVLACDGNDTAKLRFIGFAIENGVLNDVKKVRLNGIVAGFSGLTAGSHYYVQDSVGTIGTSPGTYAVRVGIATSATEIFIQKGRGHRNGAGSYADSGGAGAAQNTSVTLGFRPSIIRMRAYLDHSVEVTMASGSWVAGTYSGVRYATDESAATKSLATFTDGIIRALDAGGTDHWTITITSVSETGFTITVTQNIASPTTIYVEWEAEGDL